MKSATAKQRAKPFDQARFKVQVNRYYGLTEHCQKDMSWCQVLGLKIAKSNVKAAHLVPKSLSAEKVAHLFGVGEVVLSDPRNGKGERGSVEGERGGVREVLSLSFWYSCHYTEQTRQRSTEQTAGSR